MMRPMLYRLSLALFGLQAGFHGFTASLPLVLARAGVPDSQIGLIVGLAAVIQVPAAFVGGALVDRFGGLRMLGLGGVAYLVGAAVILVAGDDPRDLGPFVVARISQGIGIAVTLPAALSLVPRLVRPERRGFGLGFVGSAHTLTLVALPPLSLLVLGDGVTLVPVAILVTAFVVAGAGLLFVAPFRLAEPAEGAPAAEDRHFRFTFQRAWAPPLLIVLLYVAHWGVVTAYLPQRAEFAGADVGLFFAADGLAVLAFRIPSGWLADRYQPRWLVLIGLAVTAVAIGLLVLPPTTPILAAAGLLTGAGAGLVMTPLLLELSRRSTEADRGSAFAMMSAALAGALVLGSVGVSPIIGTAGFEATIVASIGGLVAACLLALADPLLRRRGPGEAPPVAV